MQLSMRYYDRIREETAIDKEGSVSIQSPTIPVNIGVRCFEHRDGINYIVYFSSKGKWTVRLHLEPEEINLVIRKLQEAYADKLSGGKK